MRNRMRRGGARASLWTAPLIAAVWPIAALGQSTQDIRIVTYNTQGDESSPSPTQVLPQLATTIEGIGQEKYVGDNILQLPDIIALQETTSNSTTVSPLATDLNNYYGSSIYSYSSYQATTSDGVTSGGGPNALIYNQKTLNLMASVGVGTPESGTNGEFRQVVRYEFQPLADEGTNNGVFYVYDSHYKSGAASTKDDGSTDGALRNGEAQIIRNDEATNLPASAAVLYVGDYNVDGSQEASYQTITAANSPGGVNQGQGFDPLNPTDNYNETWEYNSTYKGIMTEKDTDLEYRDDMQIMTGNVCNDSPGTLDYINNSLHAFGNNGSTAEGGSVNSTSNTALNDIIGNGSLTPSEVYAAMNPSTGSDHLPVVADYSITNGPFTLTWNNAGGSGDGVTWDTSNQNWNTGSFVTTYADADNVIFNDSNNGHYAVTLNTTVNPGSVVINNSSGDYTFSGSGGIAGTGSLTKSGSASATLSTLNTYSGGTNLTAGTLIIATSGALPANQPVTISGGTLTLNATAQPSSILINNTSGNVSINGSGGIGGVGSLTNSGTGSATLSTVNSYSGGTNVTAGTLIIATSGALPANQPVTITGGTLTLNATAQPSSILINNTSGNVSINGSGGIGGVGSLTESGTGSATLSTVNSYSGGTTVDAGATLLASYPNAVPTTGMTTVNAGGTLTASVNNALPSGYGGLVNNGITNIQGNATLSALTGTGILNISPGSDAASVVKLAVGSPHATQGGLTIAANSALDMTNNQIIFGYTGSSAAADSTVLGYLTSGRNGGTWNGTTGIMTSGSTGSGVDPGYALGWADGAEGVVSGLTSGQIEVKYTLLGDALLNGSVTGNDFTILVGNLNKSFLPNGNPVGWDDGDFEYSGSVNGNDFTDLVSNLNKSATLGDVQVPAGVWAAVDAYAAANGITLTGEDSVPEPGAAILLLPAGVLFLSRQRRFDPRRV